MSLEQQTICAITVSIGDTVQRVGDGPSAGLRGVVVDTRPRETAYATSIKVKCTPSLLQFQNKWTPVKLWRKVD